MVTWWKYSFDKISTRTKIFIITSFKSYAVFKNKKQGLDLSIYTSCSNDDTIYDYFQNWMDIVGHELESIFLVKINNSNQCQVGELDSGT